MTHYEHRDPAFRGVEVVRRPGRNVFVCNADAFSLEPENEKLAATMQGTMMRLREE